MLVVAWYTPMAVGGCVLATLGGLILHRIPGTVMMLISAVSIIIYSLLFAIVPASDEHKSWYYWAWIFPSMLCATAAIDLIFNVAAIFFSTSMPARRQGLAGGLSNVLLQLGIAVMLGFADVVATYTEHKGQRQSYKNVFWFELACGAAALMIFAGFVRVGSAKSDFTADEREAMAEEERS